MVEFTTEVSRGVLGRKNSDFVWINLFLVCLCHLVLHSFFAMSFRDLSERRSNNSQSVEFRLLWPSESRPKLLLFAR